jgi:hypothetical protein
MSGVNIAAATALIAAIGYLAAVWIYRVAQARQQIRARLPKPCPWPVDDHRPAQLLNSHRVGEEIRGARNLERGVGAEQGRRPVTSVVALHDRGANR